MSQKKINISFPKDDEDLYDTLIRESALTLVPTSSLIRHYVRSGMKFRSPKMMVHWDETDQSESCGLRDAAGVIQEEEDETRPLRWDADPRGIRSHPSLVLVQWSDNPCCCVWSNPRGMRSPQRLEIMFGRVSSLSLIKTNERSGRLSSLCSTRWSEESCCFWFGIAGVSGDRLEICLHHHYHAVRAQGPEPKEPKGSFDVLIEKDFDHAIYVALQFHIYCMVNLV